MDKASTTAKTGYGTPRLTKKNIKVAIAFCTAALPKLVVEYEFKSLNFAIDNIIAKFAPQ